MQNYKPGVMCFTQTEIQRGAAENSKFTGAVTAS